MTINSISSIIGEMEGTVHMMEMVSNAYLSLEEMNIETFEHFKSSPLLNVLNMRLNELIKMLSHELNA